ncbi:HEPN domain-containing protein [Paraliobacillus sp. PM-2]|uniref:HEPN domain-containing protein n=1 Tax=Paraliobacillus sp. PM-2 TaxID=1462524 RepID=UPI000B89D618|nr:HEPN domain-containing protein [Paraliobacillus sp. PM-2]
MEKLYKTVLYLLKCNYERGNWSSGLEDKETNKVITSIAKHPEFSEIINIEDAEEWLVQIFSWLEFHKKEDFSIDDSKQVLDLLKDNLQLNVKEYWVVFPLVNATLNDTIRLSEDIYIIGGEDKVYQLHDITKLSFYELESRFEHTMNSRSPIFLSHPLLAIKITHQYSSVNHIASDRAFYAISVLNILYRAYIYPEYENSRMHLAIKKFGENKSMSKNIDTLNYHIAVHGEQNWRHIPLNFSYHCRFSLEWLKNPKYVERFVKLYHWTRESDNLDELDFRFLRALKFFMKSINNGKKINSLDSESDAVLYLNIAAEVLFLKKHESDKKKKLKFHLNHLVSLTDKDQTSAIEKICKSRNDFVHEGLEYREDYFSRNEVDPFLTDAKGDTDLDVFNKIISVIISKADLYVEYANDNKKHSNYTTKQSWFNLLKDSYEGSQYLIKGI